MTGKSGPLDNAKILAFIAENPGLSNGEISEALNIHRDTARLATILLARGTPEEVENVLKNGASITIVGKQVHKRTKHLGPANAVIRRERKQDEAALYRRLVEGMNNLSHLPAAEDMARILVTRTRSSVPPQLTPVLNFLTELRKEYIRLMEERING